MKRLTIVVLFFLLAMALVFSQTDLTIHYHRFDGNYEGWNLWLWGRGLNGSAHEFDGEDEYGRIANVTLPDDLDEVGIIVRLGEWEAKDVSQDRYFETEEDGTEIWLLQGVKEVYYEEPDTSPRISFGGVVTKETIRVNTTNPFNTNQWNGRLSVLVDGEKRSVKDVYEVNPTDLSKTSFFEIKLEEPLTLNEISKPVTLDIDGFTPQRLVMMGILDQYKSEKKMGASYSPGKTVFRVWSPVSCNVELMLFDEGTSETPQESVDMEMDENGVWEASVERDLNGMFYLYQYDRYDEVVRGVDPYSKSTYANSLKSAVVNLDESDPADWSEDSPVHLDAPEDAIIYEIHVADVTGDESSGVEESLRNTYPGLTEKGTKGPDGVTTALESIVELGVTHVHVLPVYDFYTGDEMNKDFEDYYNWGYDPFLFTVPEGRYSTDPTDPLKRITELKKMIESFHVEKTGVILDMVFPHTYGLGEISPFDTAVPYYYYKISKSGAFINESGCGNTIASHRPMMRKYIVDTVKYWVEEYHVDGFRFDQMGFIDIETMHRVEEVVHSINPSALLYGEGWGSAIARDFWMPPEEDRYYARISRMVQAAVEGTEIGTFNDDIRDGIRGSVFDETARGFVLDSFPRFKSIQKGVVGGIRYSDSLFWLTDDPQQSINYAACHDNHTLWDKNVLAARQDTRTDWTEEMLKDAQKLSGAIILTSQGIPFIHAGQEFCRTKDFDENSYNSPISVNALDYARKAEFIDVYNYYKGLIEIRKSHKAFRMRTEQQIKDNLEMINAGNKRIVPFRINGSSVGDEWDDIFVIFNGSMDAETYSLPDGQWNVVVDGEKAGTELLYTIEGTIDLAPTSAYVMFK